jgi:hypothetical protein
MADASQPRQKRCNRTPVNDALLSSSRPLRYPSHLGGPSVLERPLPVPRPPGVMAWYFVDVPPGVLTAANKRAQCCREIAAAAIYSTLGRITVMSKAKLGLLGAPGAGAGVNRGSHPKPTKSSRLRTRRCSPGGDYTALVVISGRATQRQNQPRSRCEN